MPSVTQNNRSKQYQMNEFCFFDSYGLIVYFIAIPLESRQAIRHVSISARLDDPELLAKTPKEAREIRNDESLLMRPAFSMLFECKALKTLGLYLLPEQWLDQYLAALPQMLAVMVAHFPVLNNIEVRPFTPNPLKSTNRVLVSQKSLQFI